MRTALALMLLSAIGTAQPRAPRPAFRSISKKELRDRIAGGWAGQMIGVSFGAPTEFRSLGKILEGKLPKWTPERVSNALKQDDLYVDMTLALVLDEVGLAATTEDFAKAFAESKYSLWHANLAARRNLKRGIPASQASTPKFNAHAADIDFQIESDFIGLMAPGMPRAAAEIAVRAGRVMNYGDGIAGGVFVSCMYATAFFETNPRRIVESGVGCLPAKSRYAAVIRDVLAWSAKNPTDWRRTWRSVGQKWDAHDTCPSGALRSYNIDAALNGAYVALALLYGRGDFGKTIEIATRAGQDSDCNPSSAAGILGVVLGYKRIPDFWKGGLDRIATQKFDYTDYTLQTIIESTEYRAGGLTKRNGGKVEDQRFLIRAQRPRPVALPVWNPGQPVERIPSSDSRWTWSDGWKPAGKTGRIAAGEGSEATVAFEGTGAVITGTYLKTGGISDVYLDGEHHRSVDSYFDEEGRRDHEAVWHVYGLTPGKHTVRLVVRGQPYPGSRGSEVWVDDLIVFH